MPAERTTSGRILIIDDNASIHQDFRKVLNAGAEQSERAALEILEANLFGAAPPVSPRPTFEIDSAYQGQEGVALAARALADGRPYSMAFVDMRMPPGWDGVQTIERLWALRPSAGSKESDPHADGLV